jgi:hypothetical protein
MIKNLLSVTKNFQETNGMARRKRIIPETDRFLDASGRSLEL